jgi:hypothetical protein
MFRSGRKKNAKNNKKAIRAPLSAVLLNIIVTPDKIKSVLVKYSRNIFAGKESLMCRKPYIK